MIACFTADCCGHRLFLYDDLESSKPLIIPRGGTTVRGGWGTAHPMAPRRKKVGTITAGNSSIARPIQSHAND